MSTLLRQPLIFVFKLHSARYPDPAPFQLPDPRQPARSPTDIFTALAATQDRRQPRNVPPQHTAQAVHEVVVEEYRSLDPVNYELATYTPADWVRLFETRFSLSVEHLRQRFPQGTGSLLSLLARVPSGVLARLALCLASDFVPDRQLSLWSPRQVASEALLGSSRAWSWSVSCCQGLAEGEASLARSASLDACPLALPALFCLWSLFHYA